MVTDFARFPDVFQFDLADCPAIQALQQHPQHKALHALLHLLLEADVQVRLWPVCILAAELLDRCTQSASDSAPGSDLRGVCTTCPSSVISTSAALHGLQEQVTWSTATHIVSLGLQGLKDWTADNAAALDSAQLSKDDVLTKGRLMALLALGAHGPAIPLTTVQVSVRHTQTSATGLRMPGRIVHTTC